MSQAILQDISVESVFIAPGRERAFARDDKDAALKNAGLADSVHKVGLINPIDVRTVGDGFEVVCGRCRLSAVRQLGWTTISVQVGEWSDGEIRFIDVAARAWRRGMTAVEKIKTVGRLPRAVRSDRWVDSVPTELCRARQGGQSSGPPRRSGSLHQARRDVFWQGARRVGRVRHHHEGLERDEGDRRAAVLFHVIRAQDVEDSVRRAEIAL